MNHILNSNDTEDNIINTNNFIVNNSNQQDLNNKNQTKS